MRRLVATSMCLTLASCDAPPVGGDTAWTVRSDDAITGVNFRDAWGVGDDIWAVGTLYDLPNAALLHFDGETWSRVDAGIGLTAPTAIWGSADDDLWIAGETSLARWTGAHWRGVPLSEQLGSPQPAVTDIWGSAPDDVWVTTRDLDEPESPTRLRHYDGVAWTDVDGLAGEELEPGVSYDFIAGCSAKREQSWMLTALRFGLESYDYAWLLHWNGSRWTRVPGPPLLQAGAAFNAVGCRAGDAWVVGEVGSFEQGDSAYWWHGGVWSKPPLDASAADSLQLEAVWAGDGEAWVVGAENSASTGASRPQVWHVTAGGGTALLPDDLDLPQLTASESRTSPLLRAVWTTNSGRTFVFGMGGVLLEHGG